MRESFNIMLIAVSLFLMLSPAHSYTSPYNTNPSSYPEVPESYTLDSNFVRENEEREREYQRKLREDEVERRLRELEDRNGWSSWTSYDDD